MEILSANYNCRNPFVAGYLPILEDQKNRSDKSPKNKNLQILITSQTNLKLSACSSLSSNGTQPTTIYQIDVSTVCTPGIRQLTLAESNASSRSTNGRCPNEPGSTAKSKQALKNKRKKEAKRRRRRQRHVHFPEAEERIAIVIVVEEDEEIKKYRNKYWELFAIDRNRFQHRVQKLANVLEKVLVPAHRAKIYKERFSCEADATETDASEADASEADASEADVSEADDENEEQRPAERVLEINFESDDDLVGLNAGRSIGPCLIEFRI